MIGSSADLPDIDKSSLYNILDSIPSGITIVDNKCRIVYTNKAAKQIYARPIPYNSAIEQHRSLNLCYPDGRQYDPEDLPLTRAVFYGERHTGVELAIKTPEGDMRSLLAYCAPLKDTGGTVTGAIASFTDITELKKNKKLFHHQEQLAGRLVEMLEQDRSRIAMDLHDHIGQLLVGLKLEIEAAEKQSAGHAGDQCFAEAKTTIQHIISSIREMSKQLMPSTLSRLGLHATIKSLVDDMQQHSTAHIHFFTRLSQERFGNTAELAVFRITQEALSNALKHAGAAHIFITLIRRDDTLLLSVEDDGRGFDPAPLFETPGAQQTSMGVGIMFHRAKHAGGDLKIESRPGKGSHVIAEIPAR